MELLLFDPVEFQLHYNCTNFDPEAIPLERRRNFTHAPVHIVLCAIYYLLYVPCLWSIWKNRMHSCYKMLFTLGCIDCTGLWVFGFLRGYLGMTGAVYCSSPIFQYVVGTLAMACLMAEVIAQLILSINRCMAMLTPPLEAKLFAGNRAWLWMLLPTGYGIAWLFFGSALVFDGVHFTWVLNPYISWDISSTYYISKWFNVHALYAGFGLPGVYAVFFVAFLAKSSAYRLSFSTSQLVNQKQRMVFVQVFLITVSNVAANLIQYFSPRSTSAQGYINSWFGSFIEYVVVYSSLNIFGFPPVIFLTLNQTIRTDTVIFMRRLFAKLGIRANANAANNNGEGHRTLMILGRCPVAARGFQQQQQQIMRNNRITPINMAGQPTDNQNHFISSMRL